MDQTKPAKQTADINPDTQQKKEEGTGHSRGARLLARLALLLIAALFLFILYLMITGASPQALLSALFCLIVLPCLFYALQLYIRHTTKRRQGKADETKEKQDSK